MADIIIYGASGHAKVIIDIIEQTGIHKIIGLVDDTGSVNNLMGYPVTRDICNYLNNGVNAGLVAIGDNWLRSRIVSKIIDKYNSFKFVSVIHPSANRARNVIVGEGTVIMAGCNINPNVQIGKHCIVNTGASVDHDCIVNDFASIAPGVILGGNVVLGNYTAVGLGSCVIQKVKIGSHSVIGAGSVVLREIISNSVAYGNPCKFIRNRALDESYL